MIGIEEIDTGAPRVEAVINATMKRYPGESKAAQARYYEAVHQELAPLARELERENRALRAQLGIRRAEGNRSPIDGDRLRHHESFDTGPLETGDTL